MGTPTRFKCFLLAIFMAFTSQCFSQKQFQHITSIDGISQSEVYSFLEDSQGFMWFGTVDGLNRYDGYNVTIFNIDKDSPNSITNNTIRCLVEDELGRIWIGTDDGLCVYDSKKEKIHQVGLSGFDNRRLSINTAVIDKEQLYIGTSEGLLMLKVGSNNLEQLSKHTVLINIDDSNSALPVVASRVGQEGEVWFTTTSNLYQLSSNTTEIPELTKMLDLSGTLPDIRNLEEDSFGNLWIVSHDNGFLRYNPRDNQLKHFESGALNTSIASDKISSVRVDKNGDLWIGTHDKGLLFLNKQSLNDDHPKFKSIEHDPYDDRSLSSNLIYSLFVSKNNLLWIGTIGSGIDIYDPYRKPFHYFNLHNADNKSSYNTNFIRAVYPDRDDNIWIGTHNNGLFLLDRNRKGKIKKLGFGTESIFHLNDAGNGSTIVCSGLGISLVRKGNSGVEVLSSLPVGPSFYVSEVMDGIFWVASLNGVKRCRLIQDKMVVEQEYTTDSELALSINNCRVLHFSMETNELFIGTEGGGLNVLNLDENMLLKAVTVYDKNDSSNSISNNYIRSIIKSSDADIWIGTYEGLNKMTKDASGEISFKSYTRKNGLPNNTVQSLAVDDQKNIWIGTNQGLCKFEPDSETFTQYTLNDGIQSNEFSEHTIFKKPDNEIIIGGINGINTFYPEQIVSSDFQPNTTLTDFYLFNKKIGSDEQTADGQDSPLRKSISLTDSIFLNPDQNSFGFDFSAMTYNSPDKVQYAYMLEGFDEEWKVENANNRKANYTNIGFGDYTFRVKSTNNDGIWEETPKSVFVSVKTPYYLTIWAFLLYGLLGILSLIFFTNYSVLRYTTKEKILLENQHNKKVRELEELRTRFFINISHDLRTPLTLIGSPIDVILKSAGLQPEAKKLLNLVQRNVKKLKDMTEQLLDISKVEAGNLSPKVQNLDIASFVKDEALLFENAFSNKGLDLEITSDNEDLIIGFDPDMISKVISNMVSNALKHTNEGKVAIQVSNVLKDSLDILSNTEYESFVKISIEDTGDGIDQADLAMVFDRFYQGKAQNKKGYGIGLSHSKDLVEAHNGIVGVSSEKGVGSVFSFYLPNIQGQSINEVGALSIIKSEATMPLASEANAEILNVVTTEVPKTLTVLLVEDNVDLRDFISAELSKTYKVLEAEDGEKGLELAKEHFPDLIVSDVMMPKMDGMEFCKEIKSNIKTSHIPVVLLTAKVGKEAKYKGLEIGADDYISKPFEMDYLLLRIKNLLENRDRLRKMFGTGINLEPSKVTVTSIDEEFLTNLMLKVEEGIPNSNFSITSLEAEMGMSHSSFYNKIKSLTGQSAKELVFNVRMKRAKQILEDTSNIRVSEVAYMVGFTDPKYFSKRFKEYFGASPSGFVKKEN